MAVKRSSGGGKPPISGIVLVSVALVVFLAAVGFAVSIMKKDDGAKEPNSSLPISSNVEASQPNEVSEPSEEPQPEPESEPSVVSSSTDSKPSSKPSTPSPSSTSSTSSKPTSSSVPVPVSQAPSSSTELKFDANSIGSSNQSKIAASKKINNQVMAWLRIPGTNIDHPVLYHPTDVNYYMARDLNKNSSKNGVVWADPETKFGGSSELTKNTVMYGHNWTNVSSNPRITSSSDLMFGQLTSYHHLNFAKATPYIYYSTESEEMLWKVFATFYTDIGFNYIEGNPSDASFANVISGAKARSRHIFDVDVKTTDKIITLSTCTRAYGSSDKQRFVVMARLMRPGEEITAVNVSSNPNPVLPKL